MTPDLDKLEAVARAAQEEVFATWARITSGGRYAVRACNDDGESDLVADCQYLPIADFIATCSPDVVLALVGRIRALDESLAESNRELIRLMQQREDRWP